MVQDNEKEVLEYRFGDWRVIPGQRLVLRGDQTVEIAQRTLDVLLTLLSHAGHPVSQKTLLDRAWRGIKVAANNLVIHVGFLRKDFGPGCIATIAGYGYQFVYEVEIRLKDLAEPSAPSVSEPTPGEPARSVTLLRRYMDLMLGREAELIRAEKLVGESRVVSLLGPGGIGKTRLAIELGWRLNPRFPGGVKLIDLAPLKEPGSVVDATAAALGLPQHGSEPPLDAIAQRLGKLPILLIFDTCERLIDALGDLLSMLLPRAPHLWVLVTSQRRFRVPVGKSYEMSGLAVPPEEATAEPPGSAERIADFGAVQLFVERVEAVDDRFELTDGNAAAVAEICRSTDGNPLSLELAAVRVPALRIEGIRARLDRLPSILNRGSPLGPERQLSLNNMLDWSFGTLNAAEQHAYCCLGIFPANFSADAAITLIGADGTSPDAAADILCELVENSMVRAEDGADPCYRLHEAMQDHAREKLKASVEYDLIAERLVRYLIDLFIQADAAWQSMPEAEWLTLYEAEIDNVRTALDWALADSARSTLAIELTGVAARLWDTSGRLADGRRYLDRAVNLLGPDTSPEAAARVLRYAGILWRSADRLRAVALLEQSVALYRQIGDIPSLGAVLATIGSDSVYLGRYEVARSTLAEAAEILPPGDRVKSSVNVLNSLGSLALALNDTAEAERCFTQARDQARILRNALLENIYILNLGEVEFRLGAIDRAIDRAREGTGGLRSANLPSYRVCALVNFASYLALRGDQAEAHIIAEEALPLAREQGGHWLRLCLQLWALLGAADGRYSDAARLLDWVDADYSRAGEIREFTEQQIYAALSKLLAGNLAEDGHRVRGLEGSIWAEQRAVEFAQQCLVSPKA